MERTTAATGAESGIVGYFDSTFEGGEMKRRWLRCTLVPAISLLWLTVGFAADGKAVSAKTTVLTPDQLQWKPGPKELGGAEVAVLEGDPARKGFFVTRLKVPAGTKIPPHLHDNVERVTVISGKINLAMGETGDNPIVLPAGSYFSLPPKTLHNAWVDEETILQISTNGPWSMHVKKGPQRGDLGRK
jgi:quercetin dioxygenase-like cupin family protein